MHSKIESMSANPDLDLVSAGRAEPAAARRALKLCLLSDDPRAAEAAYGALRRWTWKTLSLRRFDHLDQWFTIIRGAETWAQKADPLIAARIGALSDLVYDSILFAEVNSDEVLLRRNHLGPILEAVRRNNGQISRAQLAEEVQLNDSHLSQLLTELCVLGKLERRKEGKRSFFEITQAGRILAQEWADRRRPSAPAYEPDQLKTIPAPPKAAPQTAPAPRAGVDPFGAYVMDAVLRAHEKAFDPGHPVLGHTVGTNRVGFKLHDPSEVAALRISDHRIEKGQVYGASKKGKVYGAKKNADIDAPDFSFERSQMTGGPRYLGADDGN